jgi:hypothetical protein
VSQFGTILDELMKGIGYSAFGFFAGYYVCKLRRKVEHIEELVVADHEIHGGKPGEKGEDGLRGSGGKGGTGGAGGTGGGTGGTGGTGGVYEESSAKHSGWQGRVLGVFILFLAMVTLASNLYTNQKTRDNAAHDRLVTACQAQYNRDFARVSSLRAQYADQDRAALYKMITTIISGTTQEARAKAVTDWIVTTQENDRLRAKVPIPNLEARNCE